MNEKLYQFLTGDCVPLRIISTEQDNIYCLFQNKYLIL